MNGMLKNWYTDSGKENDVVVSSRVRLARNLAAYPFPDCMTKEQEQEVKNILQKIYANWEITDLSNLSAADKSSLAERDFISPEFASSTRPGLLISKDNTHIMALEEDHVRIQSIFAGLALEEAYHAAAEADSLLDDGTEIAFNEEYGYLTHCPTNLGTGMRASVMVFLPAYTKAGAIRRLQNQLEKIGLTVRGMAGEGSGADGYLYQISNQVTLGITEEETIRKLQSVIEQLITQERDLRTRLTGTGEGDVAQQENRELLRDKARRSLGICRYATRLSAEELYNLYANLRLGASLGLLDTITPQKVDELLFSCLPGVVKASADCKTVAEQDAARAKIAGEILGGAEAK